MPNPGRLPVILAGLAALLLPEVVHACSVCFSSTEENRIAFLVTTLFLTALPLLMIGGVVWWIRRRMLEIERTRPTPGPTRAPSLP